MVDVQIIGWALLAAMWASYACLYLLWPRRLDVLHRRFKNGTRLERAWAAYELRFLWSLFMTAEHRACVKSWADPTMKKVIK